MKVADMCLLVLDIENRGHWLWDPKNRAFFGVNFPNRGSFSVNMVKF